MSFSCVRDKSHDVSLLPPICPRKYKTTKTHQRHTNSHTAQDVPRHAFEKKLVDKHSFTWTVKLASSARLPALDVLANLTAFTHSRRTARRALPRETRARGWDATEARNETFFAAEPTTTCVLYT
eukprot:5219028-Pyramimonas_sp.AAC.1